jgi:hypothetical protein
LKSDKESGPWHEHLFTALAEKLRSMLLKAIRFSYLVCLTESQRCDCHKDESDTRRTLHDGERLFANVHFQGVHVL